MEWELGEDDELDGEPGRLDSTPVTLVFTDCQTGDLHVLDGEYVTFGYLGYEIEHPPGIRELWPVALGPHPFEHHPSPRDRRAPRRVSSAACRGFGTAHCRSRGELPTSRVGLSAARTPATSARRGPRAGRRRPRARAG